MDEMKITTRSVIGIAMISLHLKTECSHPLFVKRGIGCGRGTGKS